VLLSTSGDLIKELKKFIPWPFKQPPELQVSALRRLFYCEKSCVLPGQADVFLLEEIPYLGIHFGASMLILVCEKNNITGVMK
jgi:hypothetical protein